jgi:adenylyltransferase/sulfurtransferase
VNESDKIRHARQIALAPIGVQGQLRLERSRALIVGAGGLGAPAALYLAAAGVGTIGLVDDDEVALHNLHRQILYRAEDVGRPKVDAASDALLRLDPGIRIRKHAFRAGPSNARELVEQYDLVLDGTDRFESRYALHDECFRQGKPYVYGAIRELEGQLSLFVRGQGPCYRCLYPEPPRAETLGCGELGTLGTLAGSIGLLMATEAIKALLPASGQSLAGRLLLHDAWDMSFDEIRIPQRADCRLCGPTARETRPLSVPRALRTVAGWDDAIRGSQLVDVREQGEPGALRVPGAFCIPVSDLFSRAPRELDRAKPVVVFCKRQARGQRAAFLLTELGFRDVSVLEGGVQSLIGARP